MRRTLFTVLLVAAVVVGLPSTAQADDSLNRNISGVASGTGTVIFNPSCFHPFVQHFDLTIHTVNRPDSSLSIDVCIIFASFIPPDMFPREGAGTFVLTRASGATLTGDVTVFELGSGSPETSSMDFTLTARSGTFELQHATGTLRLLGTWGSLTGSQAPFTGTLTSNLTGGSIPGNIFETTFKVCKILHVGYNRFPNGTVVNWNVTENGLGTVDSGQFTAIGGGQLGSKTYHFVDIPLTTPLKGDPVQSHVHFTWAGGGAYVATRDPGC